MRAFIAIEIPDDVRAEIAAAQSKLKQTSLKVSWVKPQNIHLTLKFLGDVSDEQVTEIQSALSDIAAGYASFTMTVIGAGGFPSVRAPRVIWIGCEEPTGSLHKLQAEIEDAAELLDIPREARGFSAHLTVGRVKFPKPDPTLTLALESLKNETFGTVQVSAVHLIQSQLRPEGPIYTVVSSHQLRGGV